MTSIQHESYKGRENGKEENPHTWIHRDDWKRKKKKKETIHSSDSVRMRGEYSAEPFFNPLTGLDKQVRFTSAG